MQPSKLHTDKIMSLAMKLPYSGIKINMLNLREYMQKKHQNP